MFIFRMGDGSLQDAYTGFDPDKPDFSKLGDVEEILVINKVLTKQVRLVAKSREVRDGMLADSSDETEEIPKRRTRRKLN